MTIVRIPPALRPETAERRDVEIVGSSVREVLETLVATFPGLAGRVLQDAELQPFVNVYVDGTDVGALRGLDTAVAPDSVLLLLPAMAGGRGSSARAKPPCAPGYDVLPDVLPGPPGNTSG